MVKKNYLSPQEIALCADAINKKIYNQLPYCLRKKLFFSDQCVNEVVTVSEIAKEIEKEQSGDRNNQSTSEDK